MHQRRKESSRIYTHLVTDSYAGHFRTLGPGFSEGHVRQRLCFIAIMNSIDDDEETLCRVPSFLVLVSCAILTSKATKDPGYCDYRTHLFRYYTARMLSFTRSFVARPKPPAHGNKSQCALVRSREVPPPFWPNLPQAVCGGCAFPSTAPDRRYSGAG